MCDHVAIPRPLDEKMNTSWWDTIATLGYLAGITEHVHLMSHVYVLPYRHPLMAAKSFLTLDEVSRRPGHPRRGRRPRRGRVRAARRRLRRAGPALDEGIDVVRAAFTDEYPEDAGDVGR